MNVIRTDWAEQIRARIFKAVKEGVDSSYLALSRGEVLPFSAEQLDAVTSETADGQDYLDFLCEEDEEARKMFLQWQFICEQLGCPRRGIIS